MNLEYDKWDKEGVPPEHELTVPFTRMLAGPLDFHQGSLRGVPVEQFRPRNAAPLVMGTPCRMLASYVVFQNHLPMVADYPSAYRGHPALPVLGEDPVDVGRHPMPGRQGRASSIVIARRHGRRVVGRRDGSTEDPARWRSRWASSGPVDSGRRFIATTRAPRPAFAQRTEEVDRRGRPPRRARAGGRPADPPLAREGSPASDRTLTDPPHRAITSRWIFLEEGGQTMRYRAALFTVVLLMSPAAVFGQDDDARALDLAKDILDRGATLFDKHDAASMAATYVEAAELIVIKRDSDSDRIAVETRHGRAEIEKAYADIFKDRLPEHRSRNTVEVARFLPPTCC